MADLRIREWSLLDDELPEALCTRHRHRHTNNNNNNNNNGGFPKEIDIDCYLPNSDKPFAVKFDPTLPVRQLMATLVAKCAQSNRDCVVHASHFLLKVHGFRTFLRSLDKPLLEFEFVCRALTNYKKPSVMLVKRADFELDVEPLSAIDKALVIIIFFEKKRK